jgi:hypothetical protein
MIEPRGPEVARQRHQDLLAGAARPGRQWLAERGGSCGQDRPGVQEGFLARRGYDGRRVGRQCRAAIGAGDRDAIPHAAPVERDGHRERSIA